VRRRALLAGLTGGLAGIAGCQGLGGSDSRDDTYEVPTRETSTVPGIDPSVDSDAPGSLSRAVSARVGPDRNFAIATPPLSDNPGPGRYVVGFTGGPGPSTPAKVWIEFTATADRPREYEFGPSPPFSNYLGVRSGSDGSPIGYVLVPTDDRPFPYEDPVPDEPTDGQWTATAPLESPDEPIRGRTVELDPGESIAGEYALLAPPGDSITPNRAAYAFEGDEQTAPSLTVSTWDPGVRDPVSSRFEERSVPELPYSAPTRWFHRVDDDDPPVYLTPSRERIDLASFVTVPTVENYTLRSVGVGRRALFKLEEGTWYPIGPLPIDRATPEFLAPGGSREWEVTGRNDGESEVSTGSSSSATFNSLGEGLYAVAATAYGVPSEVTEGGPLVLDPGTAREVSRSGRTVLAALFELSGYEAYVFAPDDAELLSREAGTVTVRLGEQSGEDREGGDPAELIVEPATTADPSLKLIAEQVLQLFALRTALANFGFGDEVERVVVLADEETVRRPIEAFGEGYRISFKFEGTAYEAKWRRRTGDG
jgi:hypothetical protein